MASPSAKRVKQGADDTEKPALQCRLYLYADGNPDWALLYDAADTAPNRSQLLQQLVIRGWLNLIHNTPVVERSMMLRQLGISQDVIAQVDAMSTEPLFRTLASATTAAAEQSTSSVQPAPAATATSSAEHSPPAHPAPNQGASTPVVQPVAGAPTSASNVEPPASTEPKKVFRPPARTSFGGDGGFGGGLS